MSKQNFLISILIVMVLLLSGFVGIKLLQTPNTEKYESLHYSSKELGVGFNYPSNLSLSFTPVQSEDPNSREVESVGIDQLLFLRTKKNFEVYSKYLESSVKENSTTDYDLDKFEINGKKIKFAKYMYGDGQPNAGCMWGDMWINYVAELDNGIVAEIKVNEQTTCDSQKEYKYKTDPERIRQALEILESMEFK
jgi:hypothetical protein